MKSVGSQRIEAMREADSRSYTERHQGPFVRYLALGRATDGLICHPRRHGVIEPPGGVQRSAHQSQPFLGCKIRAVLLPGIAGMLSSCLELGHRDCHIPCYEESAAIIVPSSFIITRVVLEEGDARREEREGSVPGG